MNYFMTSMLLFFIGLQPFNGLVAEHIDVNQHSEHQKIMTSHPHGVHTSADGIHGMAVMSTPQGLIASHMPLANSIHSHQIVIEIVVDPVTTKKISTLSKQYQLLSLLPERFDLVALMSGKLTTFKADLYSGHFERQGKKEVMSMQVKVKQILLSESLSSQQNGYYYRVPFGERHALFVHRISALPSFDQILIAQRNDIAVQDDKHRLVALTSGDAVQVEHGKNIQVPGWQIIRQLYLETQDFR